MSFAAEVVADSTGKWCRNSLRFATSDEAEAYGRDLMWRWTAVRDVQVVTTDEPVNYIWQHGRADPIITAGAV